jgi:hypothetical protein
MEIQRRFFPKPMLDNDENYLAHLEGVIDSVDEYSSMMITKKIDGYGFRIATSLPMYNNMLIEEIIKYHNLLKIRLVFSKSIKTTGTIEFNIIT